MTEPQARYLLAVEDGPWGDKFYHGDDRDALRLAAIKYLKEGRRCFILDRETGQQTDLSLKQ